MLNYSVTYEHPLCIVLYNRLQQSCPPSPRLFQRDLPGQYLTLFSLKMMTGSQQPEFMCVWHSGSLSLPAECIQRAVFPCMLQMVKTYLFADDVVVKMLSIWYVNSKLWCLGHGNCDLVNQFLLQQRNPFSVLSHLITSGFEGKLTSWQLSADDANRIRLKS